MNGITPHPASYRDPAGFVFTADGVHYRQVNRSYASHYDKLMKSGLYDRLTRDGLLIPHSELAASPANFPNHHLTLLPQQLAHLSFPSEWCPEQLKDAALLTLRIQHLAMDHGMTLKDATPFNIQFNPDKPIFIDTLSFETYDPAKPWIAYRQFCECFLFPLYLHRYTQTGTHRFAAAWPDGIPVKTAARLLPLKSRWNAGAWLHIFLQNQVSARNSGAAEAPVHFSKEKLTRLVEHLLSITTRLNPIPKDNSAWSNYYTGGILSKTYLEEKERLFRQYLDPLTYRDALDLGSNDGWFAKILAESGRPVTAADSDWLCIEKLYREHPANILPLCIDLANPTPATGFRNAERSSFTDRASADLVTALALIHHLALQNNIPLAGIADYFSRLTRQYLIIEFVPASDIRAQQLTARKTTPPADYDRETFESVFTRHFRIQRTDRIPGTERQLYLLTKH